MEFASDYSMIGSFYKVDVIKNFFKCKIGEWYYDLDYQMSFNWGQFEPK